MRGRIIDWSIRESIWNRIAEGRTRRAIAHELKLARATVDKYAQQFIRRHRAHLSAEK